MAVASSQISTRDKKVFTTGQVAKFCRVAPRTVSKWFDSGRLRGYRIPGSQDRRVPRENLIDFLKKYHMPLGELETEHQCRVLLVNLDGLLADKIEMQLPASDYQITRAANGFEVGYTLRETQPDIVVVDFAIGTGESRALGERLTAVSEQRIQRPSLIALVGEDHPDPNAETKHGYCHVFKQPVNALDLIDQVLMLAQAER